MKVNGKVPTWECRSCVRSSDFFLSVFVDDIMMVGKKQNSRPPWKRLQKHIDLEDPTPLTDQRMHAKRSKGG